MAVHLPQDFVESMHELFTEAKMLSEWDAFLQGFSNKWKRAWRLQVAKANPQNIAEQFASSLEGEHTAEAFLKPVPWSRDGYYIPNNIRLGRSLAYNLGLVYIQEASAMLPAEVLNVQPGEKILDLCAAPGGKSSQLASHLAGTGLLVSNDIDAARAGILAQNLEQQGFRNSLVTNFDISQGLPSDWNNYFDGILLDVPCSGEGMFRRDKQAIQSWIDYGPESIRATQDQLLENAANLLLPGGRIVYSTCTLNTLENEEVVLNFLNNHPEFTLENPRDYLSSTEGLRPGLVVDANYPELEQAVRIWPQYGAGEGHFAALLVKREEASDLEPIRSKTKNKKKLNKQARSNQNSISIGQALEVWTDFGHKYINDEYLEQVLVKDKQRYQIDNEKLYLLPQEHPSLDGIRVIKHALHVGDIRRKGKRYSFSPSRNLIMQNNIDIWKYKLEISVNDARLSSILRGETLVLTNSETIALHEVPNQAYIVLYVNNLALTWMMKNSGTLKNLYPKNLLR